MNVIVLLVSKKPLPLKKKRKVCVGVSFHRTMSSPRASESDTLPLSSLVGPLREKTCVFPDSELEALQTLGWAYNPFMGMNILRIRDKIFPKKDHYTSHEMCELYLAGLALHGVGLVKSIKPDICWASAEELPHNLLSPVLLANAQLILELQHPVFFNKGCTEKRACAHTNMSMPWKITKMGENMSLNGIK